MECLLRKEQLYVSLSFLTMKLVGLEGVPGRFLGSHPGGNLWHCPLRLRWWEPVGAWVSSDASRTEGSRVGSPTPQRTHLSGAACHVKVANDATCETFANETFRP